MKSRCPLFLVILVAAGSIVGPAAHRVQHSLDYAAASRAASITSHVHADFSVLSYPLPSEKYDEVVCVLCQVVDSQILLVPITWCTADPGDHVPLTKAWAASADPVTRPRGRAPPYHA
ncbi:MAG: hypothetical protein HKN37_14570 [Rhodothermales bacterium]|nr:hypothetical protein [Rhodothermales bacterium]